MDYNNNGTNARARSDYDDALHRAFWRNLGRRLGRGCNDLMSYSRVVKQLQLQERRNLGIQNVAIDKIVGSTGRARDFDLTFLPRRKENDDRWVNIAGARYQGTNLPPVMLYKVGEAYFVEDGNHRVSVARARGEECVRAMVIEFDPSTLIAEPSCTRLGFKVTE